MEYASYLSCCCNNKNRQEATEGRKDLLWLTVRRDTFHHDGEGTALGVKGQLVNCIPSQGAENEQKVEPRYEMTRSAPTDPLLGVGSRTKLGDLLVTVCVSSKALGGVGWND